MLIKFLFIRVSILSISLAIVAFILSGYRLEIPFGILIGSFVSVYKLRLFSKFLTSLVQKGKDSRIISRSLIFNLFSQAILLFILIGAIIADTYFFYGVVAGFMTIVVVICVNALTERMGWTNNNWQ